MIIIKFIIIINGLKVLHYCLLSCWQSSTLEKTVKERIKFAKNVALTEFMATYRKVTKWNFEKKRQMLRQEIFIKLK